MNTPQSYISKSLLDMDSVDNSDALIEEFLKENYKIYGSYIIKDGIVDIIGSIEAVNKDITQLTNGIFRFGTIKGIFNCGSCKSLKSLEGAPKEVYWNFYCSYCDSLTSLDGAPEVVGRDFYCDGCDSLTSLKGAPERVRGDFNCSYCDSLTSLEGAPRKVGDRFDCRNCKVKFSKDNVTNICKVNSYIMI